MKTEEFECRTLHLLELIVADRQTLYSHVEFISWDGASLVLAYIP